MAFTVIPPFEKVEGTLPPGIQGWPKEINFLNAF
jgi:hypothetical protein